MLYFLLDYIYLVVNSVSVRMFFSRAEVLEGVGGVGWVVGEVTGAKGRGEISEVGAGVGILFG